MRNLWPCEQVILVYLSELQCGSNYSLEFCITILVCCCCLVAKLCPTLLQPRTVACQAPPSTGSSRQEYWSGLPFPSLKDLLNPRNEPASPALAGRFFTTEPQERPLQYLKVKGAQFCPTLCDPVAYTVHGLLQARILEWVAFSISRQCSQPRDQSRSPAFQADSLPEEP